MKRSTRAPRHTSARKKQTPPPPPRTPRETAAHIRELKGATRKTMDTMKTELAVIITKARFAQTLARTELIKTAQALLPKARTLALRGRPRLLAVVSKIILDRHLQFTANIPKPRTAPPPQAIQ